MSSQVRIQPDSGLWSLARSSLPTSRSAASRTLLGQVGGLDPGAVVLGALGLVLAELLADRGELLAQQELALPLVHALAHVVADLLGHLELGEVVAGPAQDRREPRLDVGRLEQLALLLVAQVRRVAGHVGQLGGVGDPLHGVDHLPGVAALQDRDDHPLVLLGQLAHVVGDGCPPRPSRPRPTAPPRCPGRPSRAGPAHRRAAPRRGRLRGAGRPARWWRSRRRSGSGRPAGARAAAARRSRPGPRRSTGRASPSSSTGTTMPGSTTRSGRDSSGRVMTVGHGTPRFLSLTGLNFDGSAAVPHPASAHSEQPLRNAATHGDFINFGDAAVRPLAGWSDPAATAAYEEHLVQRGHI